MDACGTDAQNTLAISVAGSGLDDRIVKVTSPLGDAITSGSLCIKGRFGFDFVHERPSRRDD